MNKENFFLRTYFGILSLYFFALNFVIFIPYVDNYSRDMFFLWLPFWGIMLGGGLFGYFLLKAVE